jgi:hypothetical protein
VDKRHRRIRALSPTGRVAGAAIEKAGSKPIAQTGLSILRLSRKPLSQWADARSGFGQSASGVQFHAPRSERPAKLLSMQSSGPASSMSLDWDALPAPIGSFSAVDRKDLRQELATKLEIEEAHDDVRLVTLNGVVLGRLGQNRETGYWELDWREGWRRLSSQHAGRGEAEDAETWAVEEIANLMAVERSAIDAGKPWGKKSPPPGVSRAPGPGRPT